MNRVEKCGSCCATVSRNERRRCAMSQTDVAKSNAAADTRSAPPPYVPPLQRTAGQQPPIAANGGLSYKSFERNGDGGTAKALEDALAQIAEGEGQRVADRIGNAPPGAPIETRWGLGFRKFEECMEHMRRNDPMEVPAGGLALPLPYTVYERPSYSVVPSNAIWRDASRPEVVALLRQNEL